MERFDRTLKARMLRYFTHNNTYICVYVLRELVSGYNASPHNGVGMTPIEVNDSNQLTKWKKYYSQGVNRKPFKFAIRDHVRISRDKAVFAKRIRPEVVGRTLRNRIASAHNSKRLRLERFVR